MEEKISSVRLVGFQMQPWVTVQRNGPNIDFMGIYPELLKHALQSRNITFTSILSQEQSYGNELSPGNTTGILKFLHEKEADIAVMPFAITLMRMKYVDSTTPYYYSTFTCMSGSPQKFVVDNVSLIDIFDFQVWSLTILALLLLPIFFYTFLNLDKKQEKIIFCFFVFFASFTRQEFPARLYKNNKHRSIIVLFWLFGTFCLTSAYMGALLSFLTIPEKPERIDSLEDVVKYPNVKPLTTQYGVMYQAIKRSANPKLKLLLRQIEEYKSDVPFKEVFNPENLGKTSRGSSVIMAEISFSLRSLGYGCVPGAKFYIARRPFFYTGITFPMRKGLPYSFKKSLAQK